MINRLAVRSGLGLPKAGEIVRAEVLPPEPGVCGYMASFRLADPEGRVIEHLHGVGNAATWDVSSAPGDVVIVTGELWVGEHESVREAMLLAVELLGPVADYAEAVTVERWSM